MKGTEQSNIKKIALTSLVFFACLYLGYGFIIKFRLNQLGSEMVQLTQISETCDDSECEAAWTFTPKQKFLLLGNVLRTHKLIDLTTNESIQPITQVRGTSADSWVRLRVYQVVPENNYKIVAIRPKATKMGYFVGLLPRTTNHEGILSIPDIGPSVSTITGLFLAFMLCMMFGAAYIGGANHSVGRGRAQYLLNVFAVSGIFTSLSCFMSLGILDTLLPEGDIRNKVIRISLVLGLMLPSISQLSWFAKKRSSLKIVIASVATIIICQYFWPYLRGGYVWSMSIIVLASIGSLSFYRMKMTFQAVIWSLALIDSAKIFGWIQFSDYPPFYFNNVTAFISLIKSAGDLGGFATISMVGIAYRRFRRDLVLSSIQKILESSTAQDSTASVSELKHVLPDVAQLTGAGRIAVTISLPLGRPVTQTYDVTTNETKIFDDGKIPGAVTLRSLVYGDEAMFESFQEFATRLRLPNNPTLDSASYFCAVPLRVNQNIVGTLMLTRFDDEQVRKQKSSNPIDFMREDREIIHLVAERISQSLSKLMVQNLHVTAELSRSLQHSIHQAIAASSSADEFLQRFVHSVADVCRAKVMIHEHLGHQAPAIAQSGLDEADWLFFATQPFNLSPTAAPAYGPSVVALRDGKSSYVKDIGEIMDKMHPKTQDILTRMNTQSIMAIPLKTLQRSFVITLITSRNQGPADPALVAVVEATEALYVAAIEVMSQKTSVLALGQLASRLIGDDEVREKILNAANDQNLPTTIGSPRVSFLLLFDLAGSSDLSEDTEIKARAYGRFYDAVNQKCHEVLGGLIRKTIGDAVIVTWDGTNIQLEEKKNLLSELADVVQYADQIARDIGCKGARAILHYGHYFLGLVGTQTFGQIDVIGSGIDEVCKMEGQMKSMRVAGQSIKIAISSTASSRLIHFKSKTYKDSGYEDFSSELMNKMSIHFALSQLPLLAEQDHVA